MRQKTFTIAQVGEIADRPRRTLEEHIRSGKLHATGGGRGRNYVITMDALIDYLGADQADAIFSHPVAYRLAKHSRRGVLTRHWAQLLDALDLYQTVNREFVPDDEDENPDDWALAIDQFLTKVKEHPGDESLDSDGLFDMAPAILKRIIQAAKA